MIPDIDLKHCDLKAYGSPDGWDVLQLAYHLDGREAPSFQSEFDIPGDYCLLLEVMLVRANDRIADQAERNLLIPLAKKLISVARGIEATKARIRTLRLDRRPPLAIL